MLLKSSLYSVDLDVMVRLEETTTLDFYDTCLGEAVEKKLMNGDYKLPILPTIATKLIGRLSDYGESLDNITALVERDQSLAGHVLRFSNSVMFAGCESVNSLQEAIMRVGYKVIGEFATILTFGDSIFKAKGLEPLMDSVLSHAVRSAYLGREMAIMLNKDGDQQFMCGLLHTVGKPIILQMVSEMGLYIPMNPPHRGLISMTNRLHQKAGARACERWNLPGVVKACCTFYHNPDEATEHWDAVSITHLASKVSNLCGQNEPALEEALKKEPYFEVLGFDEDQILHLFNHKDKITEDTKAMLGTEKS